MTTINELIHDNMHRAFEQGQKAEYERIMNAIKFVSFEDKHGHTMLSLEDLQDELALRAEGRA